MNVRVAIGLLGLMLLSTTSRAQPGDGVGLLLARVERVVLTGDATGYFALLADSANRARAQDFASSELMTGAAHVALQERDRQPLAGGAPDSWSTSSPASDRARGLPRGGSR
jgi:hypothetical protein